MIDFCIKSIALLSVAMFAVASFFLIGAFIMWDVYWLQNAGIFFFGSALFFIFGILYVRAFKR